RARIATDVCLFEREGDAVPDRERPEIRDPFTWHVANDRPARRDQIDDRRAQVEHIVPAGIGIEACDLADEDVDRVARHGSLEGRRSASGYACERKRYVPAQPHEGPSTSVRRRDPFEAIGSTSSWTRIHLETLIETWW